MIREVLCKAFCDEVVVKPVPIGFAVKTPHMKADDDFAAFYLRKDPAGGDRYRIEDDGCLIADLEASGFDLDKESRFEAFTDMLREHDARYEQDTVLLVTDYLTMAELPQAAISFSYLLARVADLLLMVGTRVQRSFKEDLAELIEQEFGGTCQITKNAPVDQDHRDYVVDFVVRAPTGRVLAVFAGSGELKALESLLFWEQYKNIADTVKPVIVLEEAKPHSVKDRTLSRVMNSGLVLATFDGGRVNVATKLHHTMRAA